MLVSEFCRNLPKLISLFVNGTDSGWIYLAQIMSVHEWQHRQAIFLSIIFIMSIARMFSSSFQMLFEIIW